MKKYPDGTIITFTSHFDPRLIGDWQHAITKPMHYGIQSATHSDFHHVGIICKNRFFEAMTSSGVRNITLEDKLNMIDPCVEVRAYLPFKEFDRRHIELMFVDLLGQVGKGYSYFQAAFSAINEWILFDCLDIKRRPGKTFCSKLVYTAYQKLFFKILKETPMTMDTGDVMADLLYENLIYPGYKTVKRAYE